jgi:hypothetical protein
MSARWSLFIDIEGFSALWEHENGVLVALGELMRGVFRLGRSCFPRDPERLFAYQAGDGFLIVSDFHEASLDRCVSIAVALMRHVAGRVGRLAGCSIAEGDLADITGCYPKEVVASEGFQSGTIPLGMGLMTIFPVMGTALIRSCRISNTPLKGPLLLIDSTKCGRIPMGVSWEPIPHLGVASIDWVHMRSHTLERLQQNASLAAPSDRELEERLRNYCNDPRVPPDWTDNVGRLLHVS